MDIPWNHGQSMELPSHISMELHGISLEGFSWKVHGNSMEIHGNSLEISALQILLDTQWCRANFNIKTALLD